MATNNNDKTLNVPLLGDNTFVNKPEEFRYFGPFYMVVWEIELKSIEIRGSYLIYSCTEVFSNL